MMSNKPPTLISYENSSEEDDPIEDKFVQSSYSHTVLETNIDDDNNDLRFSIFKESSLETNVYTSPRSQAFNDDNVEKKMFNIKIESLEKSHLTNDFDIDNSISVLESNEDNFDPIKPKSTSASPEKIKFDISDSDKEHNEVKDLKENFKRKKIRSSRKGKMSSLKRLVSYGLGAGDTTIHDDEDEEASPSGSSSSPSSPPTAAPSPVPLSQRDRILASAEQQLIASSADVKMATNEIEEMDQIEANEIRPPPPAPSVARNRDTSGNWSDYIFDEDEDNLGQGEGEINKGDVGGEDEIFSIQTDASTSMPLTNTTNPKDSNSAAPAAEDILLDQFGNPLPQIKQPRIFWDPLGPVWSLAAGLQKIHASDPTSIQKPIDELLPEPPGRCSEALQAKFRTFYERAAREARSDPNAFNTVGGSVNAGASLDMNAVICDNKAFRNPSIYEKLLQYCDIDDSGTNAIPDPAYFAAPTASSGGGKKRDAADSRGGIYNVKRATGKRLWAAASFYEELARAQKTEMERWEKERTIQRSALNAGAPTCATSSSSSILPAINSAPPVSAAPLPPSSTTTLVKSVSVTVHERSSGKHGSRKATAETTGSKKKRSSGSAEKGSSPHSRSPGKNNYSTAFNNPFGISSSALQNVKTRKSKWDKPVKEDSTVAPEAFEPTRHATDS